MLKNYLLIALRFMSRQRGFSLINIAGLTLGIACSLLILLYLQDELQYDKFQADIDRTYRVGFEGKLQGKSARSTMTPFPLAQALETEVPGIGQATRIAKWATFPVRYEDKAFTEKYLLLVDRNFFRFFSFNLIEGNPDSVLFGERKVVMSESAAKRYFGYTGKGDRSPIGKRLELAQGYEVRVSGIAEDAPLNSHFHFTLLLSMDSWDLSNNQDWISSQVVTYFKLKPNATTELLHERINQMLGFKLNKDLQEVRKMTLQEFRLQGNELSYFVQPMADIHLRSDLHDELETNGSIEYIYLFGCIAAFIIMLACINFMNLTTAQSASRAKEVAVRKSVGAQNKRLISQFLLESYFYVIIAVVFALFILLAAIQPFNYFTGKDISFSTLFSFQFIAGLLTFVAITGIVAGSYPAFYLTQYSPIEVLKGNLRARLRTYGIRNMLVVFQFFISTCLIVATMTVYHQLQFVQRADLGFNRKNVINLLHTRNLGSNGKAFKEELLKSGDIVSASYSNRLPPNVDWTAVLRADTSAKDQFVTIYEMDYDHLKTMGYKMLQGRFYSRQSNKDSLYIILNEKAAAVFNIKTIDGQKIFSHYDRPQGRMRQVIGIMKDFNFQSLKDPIQPMAIILGNEPNWEMAIRLKDDRVEQGLATVQKLWKKYAPNAPFEYSFLDKNFEQKVMTEQNVGTLFIVFTILAILIACLGLYGLSTFTAEQQRKAIGIRKVLGATTQQIVEMLNKDFLKLVLIANVLACPTAWWIMTQWLNQFAYHTNLAWWIFLLAFAITFIIALFSVSFQAIRAASGNPVNSLRNE